MKQKLDVSLSENHTAESGSEYSEDDDEEFNSNYSQDELESPPEKLDLETKKKTVKIQQEPEAKKQHYNTISANTYQQSTKKRSIIVPY